MVRASPGQTGFNAGEFSPRMTSRVDFQKYGLAGEIVENVSPLPQGGMARRSGTRFIKEVKASANLTHLIPFVYSTEQAYMIEAGNNYFRFYKEQARIAANNVTASITNGTFDSNITGWTDKSTGAASISHLLVGLNTEGLFGFSTLGTESVGDGVVNGKNAGLKFTNTSAGNVLEVQIKVFSVTVSFMGVAKLYTDSSGQPGSQVGIDSDTSNIVTGGDVTGTFAWAATGPALSASTVYWLIITDTDGGTGNIALRTVADQGSVFESGKEDTITSIDDQSGGGPVAAQDWQFGMTITPTGAEGVLNLVGASGETSIAEQSITITETTTTHVLAFRVRGVQNDEIKLRVSTVSGGVDIINDRIVTPGWHRIAITPNIATMFIQFRNELVKNIQIDDVSILDNVPIEIETPYASTDLATLKWAQSADVLFLFHPDYQPYKLERRSDTDWALVQIPWQDGPYLDQNITDTTLAVSVKTVGKGHTLTASSAVGINRGQGFLSTDVGRLVRLDTATANEDNGWGIITAVASISSATIDLIRAAQDTSGHIEWSLGAWSDTTKWPESCAFFEQRFVAAATTEQPQTFWLSQSGDLENMQPDSEVGLATVIEDDDAIVYTIAAEKVNAIRWISPGQVLVLGTTGGEWVAQSNGDVITPLDIEVRRETAHGSANFSPVRAGNAILFIQEAEREIREFVFSFDVDGFVAPDLTILSQHITISGINKIIYAQEPDSIVWCLRNDGILAALTYKRENNVAGWSRHIIGGEFISATGNAVVESIATIPGDNGTGQFEDSTGRDEVWVIVKRTIDSATKRYIEMFEQLFEGPIREDYTTDALWNAAVLKEQKESYYSDSLLTLDVPITITNIVVT